MNIKERIAKARADFAAAKPTELPVELGGELTQLSFLPLHPDAWVDLTAKNAARPGSTRDKNAGYNVDAVAKVYPVEKITVDGESIDAETWKQFVTELSAPNRSNLASVLWGINQLEPARRLEEAGKASAGSRKKKQS